ncbi:MAG: FtsX-like permease family protein [Myxococcota bacterium]
MAAVVGQVVLGVILVLSAAASVDRVFELRAVDPGFGANRAVSIRVPISADRFPSFRQRSDVVARIAESLRSIPGVRAAGGSDVLPVGDGTVFWSLSVEDHPPEDPGGVELADGRLVTPGYMEATGISVVRGRALDTRDRAGSMPVVVVSETFGERYWPGEDPIGRRIKRRAYDSAFPWLTVVGVAADVRDGGPATDVSPTAYFPYAQHDVRLGRQLSFVVRSDRVLDELVPEIRIRVASVDPMAPIVRISTLDELLSESMIAERTSGNVLGGLALGGLALLGIGLYGVMSRAVLERRRELGLRRALGAHASEAVWLVLKTGSVSVMVGTVIGLLAGPTVVRLSGLVLGEALDVPLWSYAAAAALLLTVGAVAGVVPALRAVRVSPIISLRSD